MDQKEALKQLYREALERASTLQNTLGSELCFVPAICGRAYRDAERKVMVVGRAPNGWSMRLYEDSKSPEAWFPYGLSWVYSQKQADRSDILCRNDSIHKASVAHSKFWQFLRYYLWMRQMLPEQEKERFADAIVWSNLYKIASEKGGNPNAALRDETAELCDEILLAEIEYYDPDEVWFITRANGKERPDGLTGCQWFCRDRFPKTIVRLRENASRKKIYVFSRPERKRFEEVASTRSEFPHGH